MEYIYATMILHAAEKEINEENIVKILEAAGVDVEETRVKALVASLDGVDIEDAINKAAVAPVAVAAAPVAGGAAPAAAEEAPEEDKKAEEESGMAGLGALFG